MTVNMSFKNLESTNVLITHLAEIVKNYAHEKSDKLKKYFHGKTTINWNFAVENLTHVAHCHLVGNNMDYFGEAQTENLYASIDMAVDKIEKQLRKHKEIVKDHLHKARD